MIISPRLTWPSPATATWSPSLPFKIVVPRKFFFYNRPSNNFLSGWLNRPRVKGETGRGKRVKGEKVKRLRPSWVFSPFPLSPLHLLQGMPLVVFLHQVIEVRMQILAAGWRWRRAPRLAGQCADRPEPPAGEWRSCGAGRGGSGPGRGPPAAPTCRPGATERELSLAPRRLGPGSSRHASGRGRPRPVRPRGQARGQGRRPALPGPASPERPASPCSPCPVPQHPLVQVQVPRSRPANSRQPQTAPHKRPPKWPGPGTPEGVAAAGGPRRGRPRPPSENGAGASPASSWGRA